MDEALLELHGLVNHFKFIFGLNKVYKHVQISFFFSILQYTCIYASYMIYLPRFTFCLFFTNYIIIM